MLHENKCPRCGSSDALGSNSDTYEDGIHQEEWCDNCGWSHVTLLDPTDMRVSMESSCDGFGMASISGSAGAVSIAFDKQMTKEAAIEQFNALVRDYAGIISFKRLTYWNEGCLEEVPV